MAITGGRFLKLNGTDAIVLSRHALGRLRNRAHAFLSAGEALELFRRARQVRVKELSLRGYRPGYGRRLSRGMKSWYFRMVLHGQELIAVVGQRDDGPLAWMTTYGRNAQTDLLSAGLGLGTAGLEYAHS
jgi:hypothetical protein